MTNPSGGVSGHACILVGEARELVAKRREYISVERLAQLLHENGITPEQLGDFAVVVHPPHEVVTDGGGVYSPNATLTHKSSPSSPERRFKTVIHVTVGGELGIRLVTLHETGHVCAHLRGSLGGVLYKNSRFETALRVVGYVLAPVAFCSFFATLLLGDMHEWQLCLTLAGMAFGVFSAIMPHFVLWCLSTAEWKANWFYLKNRRSAVVLGAPDETEVLYTPAITTTRKK